MFSLVLYASFLSSGEPYIARGSYIYCTSKDVL